ncbi:MAG: recombinase family protein [Desulfomonile sp.]|nr:recombinase family protein [Desulfomonile sp.]
MATKPIDQKLMETITGLMVTYGNQYSRIAEELNEREIKTPAGKAWSRNYIRVFIKRHALDAETQATQDRGTDSPQPPRFKEAPQDLMVMVSPDIGKVLGEMYHDGTLEGLAVLYRSGELTALVDSWRKSKGVAVPVQEIRPVFKGERKNTGVHVNKEILKLAAAKAKSEKARTGGSLSMLVELLLWRYVGSPAHLLDTGPE